MNIEIEPSQEEARRLTIFRKAHNRENPYAQISKRVLRDNRLSAKSIGLMCYFLSLPDDWQININELLSHFKDGETSIRAGIKELTLLGYIEVQKNRGADGKFSSTTFLIHEDPINPKYTSNETYKNHLYNNSPPYGGFPHADNPHVDFPHVGNRALLKTEVNKDRFNETEVTNIFNARASGPVDNIDETAIEVHSPDNVVDELEDAFEDFWQEYPNQVGKLKSKIVFFQKCIQKKVNPQVLVKAARNQAWQRQRRQELGLMVPEIFKNPTGWLEEEKWEDVIQSEEQLKRESDAKWNSKRTTTQLQRQKNNGIEQLVESRMAARREKNNMTDTNIALRKEIAYTEEFGGFK